MTVSLDQTAAHSHPAPAAARESRDDDPHRRRRDLRWVIALVIAGAVLRVTQYLHHSSYWNDEAAIVLNVFQRDYASLLKPLDFSQAAPPLFLWSQRALYLLGGPSEFVLRAPSVLLALLSLPMFAAVAWRVLRPPGAVWAVAFFAINDRIIPHAAEVKQYCGDIFCAVLLLFVAFGARRPDSPGRRLALASVLAAVAVWYSFPAILIYGGIALALAPQVLRGSRGWLALLAGLLPLISSALLAKLMLAAPRDPYLNEFWAAQFADLSYRFPLWLGRAVFELCNYPFASLGALVLIVAVIGGVELRARGANVYLIAAGGTLALVVLAAAVRMYPFGGARVTLYLLPHLFLFLGAGAQAIVRPAGPPWRRLAWLAPATLLGFAVVQCAAHAVRPEFRSTIRPVVEFVRHHRTADQPIYLAGGGHMPQPRVSGRNVEFLCYWRRDERNIHRTMLPPEQITDSEFWVVYSIISAEKASRMKPWLDQLDAVADRAEDFKSGAAGAILFHRRPRAASTRNVPAPIP